MLPARHIPRPASLAAARLGAGGTGRGAEDINEDFTSFFFDSVSLELANKYPADLILLDADTSPEDMAGVPTWAALPAVQAGQFVSFRRLGSWTYEQHAGEIEGITTAVRAANPDLV